MDQKIINKYNRKGIIYTISIFVLFSIFYTVINVIFEYNQNSYQKQQIIAKQQALLEKQEEVIIRQMDNVLADALHLYDTVEIHGEDNYSLIEEEWLSFANRKKIYDQIRLIDSNGDERMRINYQDGQAYVEKQENLQNKSHRYYFEEIMQIKKGEIYISQMDLNIDHGQIVQPYEPVIRIGVPYYTADDVFTGALVINYSAQRILEDVRMALDSDDTHLFIVNNEGYWLMNTRDSSKEWAFMYDDKQNMNFMKMYEEEWSEIQKYKEGHLIGKGGVFYFAHLRVGGGTRYYTDDIANLSEKGSYLMVYTEKSSELGSPFYKNLGHFISEILKRDITIYLLAAIISMLIGKLITNKQRVILENQYYAAHDTMTGVLNRRGGKDKIQQLLLENKKISICFCDINNLKTINDTLGHEFGDDLIMTVTKIIETGISDEDLLIRLGGDEFLIVFVDKNEKETEKKWNHINKQFKCINNKATKGYTISVSHGIKQIPEGVQVYSQIEKFIEEADKKMYQEKQRYKEKQRLKQSVVLS